MGLPLMLMVLAARDAVPGSGVSTDGTVAFNKANGVPSGHGCIGSSSKFTLFRPVFLGLFPARPAVFGNRCCGRFRATMISILGLRFGSSRPRADVDRCGTECQDSARRGHSRPVVSQHASLSCKHPLETIR